MIDRLILMCTSLIVQPKIQWRNYNIRPEDVNLSCFYENNNTWSCAEDTALMKYIDNDDSY